jgi:Putative 2OG-Fe(II) oxygenase
MLINLFPTCVGLYENKDNESVKRIFNRKYGLLKSNQVGEMYGQNDLHLDVDLHFLYNFIAESSIDYLKQTGLNFDNFYLVLAKSWMSFVNNINTVPPHNHSDHHLSFTYYVDVPNGSCDHICFSRSQKNINEPFYGAFNSSIGNPPNIITQNIYNNNEQRINIKEGQLCVFPSKLDHFVPNGNYLNERKCIAGDFLLIYKNRNNSNPWGMYTPETWKYYETKVD